MRGISVGMGLEEFEIRYGKQERYGRKERIRSERQKKSLNCASIGWNTLILSFTPLRNIRYYREIDKVRIPKVITSDILICLILSWDRVLCNLPRVCYIARRKCNMNLRSAVQSKRLPLYLVINYYLKIKNFNLNVICIIICTHV